MAIADYLRKLVELKNQLVANLKSMGVTADESEKLNTLVPKVLECKTEQNVEFVEGYTGYFATDDNISQYIETIRIPEGVTGIFNSKESNQSMFLKTKHIILPSTLKEIGKNAFSPTTYDRNSLISIFIPKSVRIIGTSAFLYCRGLEHIYYEGTEEEWNAITKSSGWNSYMGYDVSGGTKIHYNYVPE